MSGLLAALVLALSPAERAVEAQWLADLPGVCRVVTRYVHVQDPLNFRVTRARCRVKGKPPAEYVLVMATSGGRTLGYGPFVEVGDVDEPEPPAPREPERPPEPALPAA